ncbi:MAG: hypothetical protein M3217_06660 [Actinomycetota bacterium]|nr:hypothetical protein [Actinomycetota bacterium]
MAFLDLSRRGDSSNLAGAISDLAALPDGGRVVTAVRAGDGTLKLIHWEIHPDGSVARLGDSGSQAGAASHLALARSGRYVAACRTGAGNLKLINWDVSASGPITRAGDSGSQAGAATLIEIVGLAGGLFVVACRTGAGDLKLISWRLNADGTLTRLADSGTAAGTVSEIALIDVSAGGATSLLTAVRDGDGDLKLITWSVAASGTIARLGDSGDQAGSATMIRAARTPAGPIVTSVRDGSGNLKLITWQLSADRTTITRRADSGGQAGSIGDNALLAFEDGVVSAVRDGGGNLKLISWAVAPTGAVTRRGDSGAQAGNASMIQLLAGNRAADAVGRSVTMITPVRTAAGTLKLITWGPPTCIGVHVRTLVEPDIDVDTMFDRMREAYATVGITVNRLTTANLDLPLLEDLDVGRCIRGETTDEQDELFANRDGVGANEVVVYFVRSTDPPLNGCAAHPAGQPGAVVARVASQFTLGHEIGHVLGLRHCDTDDNCLLNRLMTGCGTANINKVPPDLIDSEAETMHGSNLTVACEGGS